MGMFGWGFLVVGWMGGWREEGERVEGGWSGGRWMNE